MGGLWSSGFDDEHGPDRAATPSNDASADTSDGTVMLPEQRGAADAQPTVAFAPPPSAPAITPQPSSDGFAPPSPAPVPPADSPPERDGHRRSWIIGAAVVIAAGVVAGGVGLALKSGDSRPDRPAAAQPADTASNAAGQSDPALDAAAATSSDQAVPDPATSSVATSEAPPPPPTRVGLIDISAVSDDAQAVAIGRTLNVYFAGVNAHDADRAVSVFDVSGNIDPTDSRQVRQFGHGISTTTDDQIAVTSIDYGGGSTLRAAVDFRSRQATQFGPDGDTCTQWDLTYLLKRSASSWLIIRSDDVEHQSC